MDKSFDEIRLEWINDRIDFTKVSKRVLIDDLDAAIKNVSEKDFLLSMGFISFIYEKSARPRMISLLIAFFALLSLILAVDKGDAEFLFEVYREYGFLKLGFIVFYVSFIFMMLFLELKFLFGCFVIYVVEILPVMSGWGHKSRYFRTFLHEHISEDYIK